MSFNLLIRGASVVGSNGVQALDVGVSDGLIAELGRELVGPAREQIDATGLHLLPGVIDAHVHLNEPGRADWEGFDTGTRALAAGGATAAVDMPLNSHPPTISAGAFDAKRRCLRGRAFVDVAGAQTMLALLLSEGHFVRGLALELITQATSCYVARRFGFVNKGRLDPGADADLVLVDLGAEVELGAEDLHYRHRHSPFIGRSVRGAVVRTIVRGRTVFAEGQIVGPPCGRLLIPEPSGRPVVSEPLGAH